ncbi:hypothetical protein BS50DRAFT_592636 [Corynespora cassiicola Philippines]|uniref:Uncharacterized protein n=1 Tax=Corynespora cassiicola Philippines TaxID=1448308 RepID=A0A2T2N9H2_CORCC|nr:hypothetical protein BS50DRAFT_592636 [Corynespora cassiicola Philippines]
MGIFTGPALFDHFFPQEEPLYKDIIQDYCWYYYHRYKTLPVNWYRCRRVLECVLEQTGEITKAQLAITNLILGLVPTLLSWLGNGVFEVSVLSSQRPFLSILLSLGAPVFSPTSLFPRWQPDIILDKRSHELKIPTIPAYIQALISFTQYIFAGGAIGNLTHLSYEMSYKSISLSSGCHIRYFVTLWIYLGVLPHLVGYGALQTRSSWVRGDPQNGVGDVPTRNSIGSFVATEVQPCASNGKKTLIWREETMWGLFLVNFATLLALAHVVWGTVILGSTTLVGPSDATMILGRFMASTVICRAILMFEMAGLRQVVNLKYPDTPGSSNQHSIITTPVSTQEAVSQSF